MDVHGNDYVQWSIPAVSDVKQARVDLRGCSPFYGSVDNWAWPEDQITSNLFPRLPQCVNSALPTGGLHGYTVAVVVVDPGTKKSTIVTGEGLLRIARRQ
jgi:hypothetical protein